MKFNLKNLSIRAKLLLGFGSVLALLALVAIGAYRQVKTLEQTMALSQGKEAFLGRAQSALWELRYGFPQFLVLTGAEDRRKILDAEPRLYATLEENLKKYGEALGLSDEEQKAHKVTSDAFAAYKVRRAKWFELIAAGKPEEAAEWRAAYTTPLGAAAVKTFGELIDVTQRNDERRIKAQAQAANEALALLQTLAAIGLLIGIGAAYFVVRALNRPLARLQGTIEKVARGDETARARLESEDELGRLGGAFDKMLDERFEAFAKSKKDSEALNNSIIEILRSVSKLAQGDLRVQAPVREDVTGALSDAINSMADATAKALANVNASSAAVRSESQTGRETVLSTAKGMNEVRGTIQETGKRIKRLGERSQEIGGIIKLIDDIAERTSVLALNANMQAAVAGEAGRGFRVVADEVQRLAERSKEATDQIAKLVSAIQGETNETIVTMEKAIGEVVKGGELAEKAAEQVSGLEKLGSELYQAVQAFTLPEQALAAPVRRVA